MGSIARCTRRRGERVEFQTVTMPPRGFELQLNRFEISGRTRLSTRNIIINYVRVRRAQYVTNVLILFYRSQHQLRN